jgi:predicted kinase
LSGQVDVPRADGTLVEHRTVWCDVPLGEVTALLAGIGRVAHEAGILVVPGPMRTRRTSIGDRPRVLAYRGLPGCGKTTDAQRRLQEARARGTRAARVSRDDVRRGLGLVAGATSDLEEAEVTAVQHGWIRAVLAAGVQVVLVDDTNLRDEHLEGLRELAQGCGASFQEIDLRGVPLEVCIARDAVRSGPQHVGGDRIRAMAAAAALNSLDDVGELDDSPPLSPTNGVAPMGVADLTVNRAAAAALRLVQALGLEGAEFIHEDIDVAEDLIGDVCVQLPDRNVWLRLPPLRGGRQVVNDDVTDGRDGEVVPS